MSSGTTSESYLYVVNTCSHVGGRTADRPDGGSQNTRRSRLRGHEQSTQAAIFLIAAQGIHEHLILWVITKSYSAGKIRLTVLCVDEVLGEFLRIGLSCSASASSTRLSSTK